MCGFGGRSKDPACAAAYQLAAIAGGLAPIIALSLLGDVSDGNTVAVGIYVCIASAISIVAVLFAKETCGSSLRHDRVLEEAASGSPDARDA